MRKTIVDVIRVILATCTKSVGYEKFFFSKCFECTGGMMDTVVMKYISVTIQYTLLTVGIWMLVPVEVRDGHKRVSDDVLNLPKFRSWRGCLDLPSKCRWITGIV